MSKENFIYGLRPVIEAIMAGKEIDKVLVKKGLKGGPLSSEMMGLVKNTGIPYQYVPIEKLNRVTRKNHQGVIAFISAITYQHIEDILPFVFEQGETPLVMVLEGITDVRNLGAIVRTAEGTGVHAVIVPEKGSAMINEDAVKTSAGALHKVPVCRSSNLANAIKYLKESGLYILAATEKSDLMPYQADLKVPLSIIIGSEEKGISRTILELADEAVSIPMKGSIASFNVSVSAGMILYEVVRQRQVEI